MENFGWKKFNPESKEGQPTSKIVVTATNTTIDLHDIITLIDKLWPSGKQNFLHQLSQEKNLSENVSNLLINQADSVILLNLCMNAEISWALLEKIVQKLLWIVQWTEKVVAIISPEEGEYYQEDDESEESVVSDEILVKDIAIFLEILFKNPNLTSEHIESLMQVFSGSMSYRFMANLCSHLHTPSSILEQIYEMNPHNMQDIIVQHPNLLWDFKAMIERVIQQKEEKNKIADAIDAIKEKHSSLDIQQILQYYENKEDQTTCKIIAEHMYQENLWSYRYWSKQQHENLTQKLQLVEKYALWEDHTLRILYDMIGDSIVERWTLQAYMGDSKYLSIPEVEKQYGIVIDNEHIKIVCQEILENMSKWHKQNIDEIEHIYQVAKDFKIEIPENIQKLYITANIAAVKDIKDKSSGGEMDRFEIWHYFYKSLQLVLEHKNIFSEKELEQYVKSMNYSLSFPLIHIESTLSYVQANYGWSTTLWNNAKKDWFKDVKSLKWMEVFDLIKKLELSDAFTHQMAIEKLKKNLQHDHDIGKKLIERFKISREEIIDLIISARDMYWKFVWEFASQSQYSLTECLKHYQISEDEVIPSFMWEIKAQVIKKIQKKDYKDAQTIITKYNLSDNPDFQEEVELLNTLLKK